MGVPFFTHKNKRLRKSTVAEYTAAAAERFLSNLSRAEEDIRRISADIQHVVRLSAESYSSYRWLLDSIKLLKSRTNCVDIQIMARSRSDPLPSVLNRHIDIAVMSGETGGPGSRRQRSVWLGNAGAIGRRAHRRRE